LLSPLNRPPPWNHTMTGRGVARSGFVSSANTFRYRQS
jgi:hypothetical protein